MSMECIMSNIDYMCDVVFYDKRLSKYFFELNNLDISSTNLFSTKQTKK